MPLAVLLTVAGLQVPVMPLGEVVGSVGAAEPEQIVCAGAKFGTMAGVTVTEKVTGEAHWPPFGVKT